MCTRQAGILLPKLRKIEKQIEETRLQYDRYSQREICFFITAVTIITILSVLLLLIMFFIDINQ